MHVYRTLSDFQTARAALTTSKVGAVPTMGYLHEGHLSLMNAARQETDTVLASIFVNPTQFNQAADLEAYPRDEARDLAMLEAAGVDWVFIPSAEAMYPADFQTYVDVEGVAQGLEGEHRPGHFRGVATVVAKLFNIMRPTHTYFGQKDAQQVAVVRQLVRDLNLPIQIVACPIVREADGLAMSSRNARLSPTERAAASVLYRALSAAQQAYDAGEAHPQVLRDTMQAVIAGEPLARPDYVSVADALTLQELDAPSRETMLLSMAVFIGEVRLIDNIQLG